MRNYYNFSGEILNLARLNPKNGNLKRPNPVKNGVAKNGKTRPPKPLKPRKNAWNAFLCS
ncbi:hypothetical protein GCM10007199_08570 [Fictibacillus barbaricus]|nr:hypothetical protein GCM10007199_08570 [Fictibacillus barbaricus]